MRALADRRAGTMKLVMWITLLVGLAAIALWTFDAVLLVSRVQ